MSKGNASRKRFAKNKLYKVFRIITDQLKFKLGIKKFIL